MRKQIRARQAAPLHWMMAALIVLAPVVAGAATTSAVSGTSAVYAQVLTKQVSLGRSVIFVNVRNIGITNHVFEWTVTGGPTSCTVDIESSTDTISWSTESTKTCTTAGMFSLPDTTFNFVTVNLTALSGGTNPNISVAYRGYLPGQGFPVRPQEGGTGATTAFTAGSIPFAIAGGVYQQNNTKLFWDNDNWRLCLLSNSCVNPFDVNGGKFFVTSAGAATASAGITAKANVGGTVASTVQGASGQSANLEEWKDSVGAVLAFVDKDGAGQFGAGVKAIADAGTTVPSVAKGAAGQTADLEQWQDSTGAVLAKITKDGAAQFEAGTTAIADAVGTVPSVVKGAAGQTADLEQWQDSTGTPVAKISKDGAGTFNAGTTAVADVAGTVPATVKGAVTQTADLGQWKNNSDTVLASVSKDGAVAGHRLDDNVPLSGTVKADSTVTTVANTVAETSLNSYSIPASTLAVDRVIRVTVTGTYSAANGTDTVTLRGKAGGAAWHSIVSTAATVTDQPWSLSWVIITKTIGASGDAESQLPWAWINGVFKSDPNTAVESIDTTQARTLDLTAEWSAALAGNTISIRQFAVEVLN